MKAKKTLCLFKNKQFIVLVEQTADFETIHCPMQTVNLCKINAMYFYRTHFCLNKLVFNIHFDRAFNIRVYVKKTRLNSTTQTSESHYNHHTHSLHHILTFT